MTPDTTEKTGGSVRPGSLADRAVLVTGGNGGIGLGMASALGRAGARIVVWGRNEQKNDVAAERLRSEGTLVDTFICDVSQEEQVIETFARSLDAVGGRIDSVFANAGYSTPATAFTDLSLEEWRRVMSINLDGTFLTLRTATRHMVESGGGALVAVSSTTALFGAATNEAYGAAKTGILGLVRALAVELAPHRIRVNSLVPGWTTTDLTGDLHGNDRFLTATTRRTPVRRWADPDEYGPAAVFLADPTTTFHTGDALVVDGGYTIG